MKIRFSILMAVTLLCLTAAPALAQVPDQVRLMLEKAAEQDAAVEDGTYLASIVEIAIAAFPDARADIEAFAGSLADATEVAEAEPPAPVEVAEAEAGPAGLLDRFGFSGDVQAGGSLSSGNTEEQALTFIVNLIHSRGRWTNHVGLDFAFTRTMGVTSKQRFVGDYKLDYAINERAFAFGFLQYEDERFSGFDYRVSESAGLGYKVVAREDMLWSVEGGPALRQNKLLPAGTTESEFGGRLNSEFEWLAFKNATLTNSTAIFFGTKRATFDNTAALKLQVNARLASILSYNLQWDGNVPAGREQVDTLTRFTLQYSF